MEPNERKSQFKVLIVEDDPEIRLAMAIRLKANNYSVGFAIDGVAAIAQARRQDPDVILLDLGLPAADGFAVMERLRANLNLASIPVIVVSGRDSATHSSRSLKAGARMFLQKPVRNADLLVAIEQVLGATPPAGPAARNIADASRTMKIDLRPGNALPAKAA
jgi:DNA-binding response OmpR family regulator